MRIVIDVDDTILDNKCRDYTNAIPKLNVIAKINNIQEKGNEIILYTSRGMMSCNGDIKLAEEKNRIILEKWLKENGVKYNELIFGKPLGDMYIDDKCLNVNDFISETFEDISYLGGSNKKIERIGNIIKKELLPEKFERYLKWYDIAKNICNTPEIISTLYNNIYIRYIRGTLLKEIGYIPNNLMEEIINIIRKFSKIKFNRFNLQKHIDNLEKNRDKLTNNSIDNCIRLLRSIENILIKNASFSHSDFTINNIIISKGNIINLIDTEYDEEASSYLLDYAKLRMSLFNEELNFDNFSLEYHILNNIYKEFCKDIYNAIVILQYMYTIRIYRYAKDKEKILYLIGKLEEEEYEILGK